MYPKNDDVTQHKTKRLNQLETTKYSIQAIDCKKDKNTGQLDVLMPTKISDTGGLIKVLDVAVGARVMLTYNINTPDGLVNGAMGVFIDIIEKLLTVTTILVQCDNDVVGLQAENQSHYRNEHPNALPICRQELWHWKDNRSDPSSVFIGFSIGFYYSQSSRNDSLCYSSINERETNYVALSRVKQQGCI